MLEALRARAAQRATEGAIAARRPRRLAPSLSQRRVLVAMPDGDATGAWTQKAAWALIRRFDLPARAVVPVVHGQAAGVPDAFAGDVVHLSDLDWRRLPRRAVGEALWSAAPDVALDLCLDVRPWAGWLVGGAPAAVRVGLDPSEAAAPHYDLVAAGAAPDGLARVLGSLDPPLLPLKR